MKILVSIYNHTFTKPVLTNGHIYATDFRYGAASDNDALAKVFWKDGTCLEDICFGLEFNKHNYTTAQQKCVEKNRIVLQIDNVQKAHNLSKQLIDLDLSAFGREYGLTWIYNMYNDMNHCS